MARRAPAAPSAAKTDAVPVFGVRHLSPGAAWHLRAWLDERRPKAVLVEGPTDFTPLIGEIVAPGVVPPIAMLAYTSALPVRTILYPLARYSPEYQALLWAAEHGVEARFVDLPSGHMIGLQGRGGAGPASGGDAPDDETDDGHDDPDAPERHAARARRRADAYDALARAAGLDDYETWWEQHFEHDVAPDRYRRAALALGTGLRELERDHPDFDFAENLVREAHMRREIGRARAELGLGVDEIVVVVGAFHAPNLDGADAMTDDALARLPREPVELTLMPYDYRRLSTRSGYGAGNRAPAYFELVWEHLKRGAGLDDLATDYLSRVARLQRMRGVHASSAEAIEGVRLSRALAAFRDARQPVLDDLHDAATTLMGQGRRAAVAESLAELDVGTRVGRLPDGARQTSIQQDFAAQLTRLKLERFRSPVREPLRLDLRENRSVASEAAARLGLERSFFLHRLVTLGIGFGVLGRANDAEWIEPWELQWEPAREIELVEAVFLGDTVEQAAAMRLANRLGECTDLAGASELVRRACLCGFPEALRAARRRLHEIAAGSSDFVGIAAAVRGLGRTLRYGDVRKLDLSPLRPLLVDLHAQACIQLEGACATDADGARRVAAGMDGVHETVDAHHELLDEAPWLESLARVARRDDVHPFPSGVAAAMLIERAALDEALLGEQLALRLSPGMPADLGAAWFEGLASRNRYGLLSRTTVWEHLAGFVRELPDEDFPRALVCLRRALGGFSTAEKRRVVDELGAIWNVGRGALAGALETPLDDDEKAALDDLADMDFDDL